MSPCLNLLECTYCKDASRDVKAVTKAVLNVVVIDLAGAADLERNWDGQDRIPNQNTLCPSVSPRVVSSDARCSTAWIVAAVVYSLSTATSMAPHLTTSPEELWKKKRKED